MIIEYDDDIDTLWMVLSQRAGARTVVESETPGVLLRVDPRDGTVFSVEILAYRRRIARGPISIPEIDNPDLLGYLQASPLAVH